jgi:cob(I)alamin adenosyltransferase
MKIYTKRGDSGETDLFGGMRVSKAHPRVRAYGAVDAANAHLGLVAASASIPSQLATQLPGIMSDLLDLGAELASVPERASQTAFLKTVRVTHLENLIDQSETQLPELKNFVLPTGCELSARLHLARVAVRFAEQEVVALGEPVRPEILQYLNRLSDLCFSWARWANILDGQTEVLWVKN